MSAYSINQCKLIDLPIIQDSRGNLTFIEGGNHIPFDIKRIFYLYHIPEDTDRGAHALKKCQQILIAVAGSFDVIIEDGTNKKRIHLNQPHQGLLIPAAVWREMDRFTSDAVCLVLASERYSEDDYYRNYEEFITALQPTSMEQYKEIGKAQS